jgi:hypothetical protein
MRMLGRNASSLGRNSSSAKRRLRALVRHGEEPVKLDDRWLALVPWGPHIGCLLCRESDEELIYWSNAPDVRRYFRALAVDLLHERKLNRLADDRTGAGTQVYEASTAARIDSEQFQHTRPAPRSNRRAAAPPAGNGGSAGQTPEMRNEPPLRDHVHLRGKGGASCA